MVFQRLWGEKSGDGESEPLNITSVCRESLFSPRRGVAACTAFCFQGRGGGKGRCIGSFLCSFGTERDPLSKMCPKSPLFLSFSRPPATTFFVCLSNPSMVCAHGSRPGLNMAAAGGSCTPLREGNALCERWWLQQRPGRPPSCPRHAVSAPVCGRVVCICTQPKFLAFLYYKRSIGDVKL